MTEREGKEELAIRAQFSNKRDDAILVLEATAENASDVEPELARAAMALFGQEQAAEFMDGLTSFLPGTAGAVGLIQRELGGTVISDTVDIDTFGFPTNNPQPDPSMTARGFVADRYGKHWHNTRFSTAPNCECPPGKNKGKKAYVAGVSKAGKPYSGWFCANCFGARATDGCPASFNGPFPNV